MSDVLLISVLGSCRSRVAAALVGGLASIGAALLDVKQSVVNDALALTLLVRLNDPGEIVAVRRLIDHKAAELDAVARVRALTDEEFHGWTIQDCKQRFILTLLAPRANASQLALVAKGLDSMGLCVENLTRLSAPASDLSQHLSLQFTVSADDMNPGELRSMLLSLAQAGGFDVAVQNDSIFRTNRRLVAFDMDSTLIQMEVIDELARLAGVGEKVAAITEAAMRGKLDFETSFRHRLSLLRGLPVSVLDDLANRLPVTSGVPRLMRTLKSLGYKTAILSGGFTYFARRLQRDFGFDYIAANELDVQNGALTGKALGRVVTGNKKAELLREIARREEISMEQTVAVGDGANDLPMLTIAGLGVAFHAKPVVREKAAAAISATGLDGLLYLLGLSDKHIDKRSHDFTDSDLVATGVRPFLHQRQHQVPGDPASPHLTY